MTEDFIDSFERELVEAGERRRDARVGRRFRRGLAGRGGRRGAAAVLVALAVGVPAATATVGGWNPFDEASGNGRIPAPSVSARPVDPALAATLGVLRRPQSASDRAAITSERLKGLSGDAFRGAQLDSIRLVDPRSGVVLVPFEEGPVPRDDRGRPLPGFEGFSNVACIVTRTTDGAGAISCHTAEKVRSGLAVGSGSGDVSGLVPDGVARVRLIRGDESAEAPVRNNFFRADGTAAPLFVEWLAADGSLVKRIDLNDERLRSRRPGP